MWIRDTVHHRDARGIIWEGHNDQGVRVFLTEAYGDDSEVAWWRSLVTNPPPGVWGLLEVERLSHGAYRLVSEKPSQWSTPTSEEVAALLREFPRIICEDTPLTSQAIRVAGVLWVLPVAWLQFPGAPQEEDLTAPTKPLPVIRIPRSIRWHRMLPVVVVVGLMVVWTLIVH